MTTEEAIQTIEIAIAEVEWYYPMNYAAAFDMALAALRAQAEAEKNEPLTLEELRELDGEPVWASCLNNPAISCWGYMDQGTFIGYHSNFFPDNYGVNWLAYRRKPEEAPAEATQPHKKTNADRIRSMSDEELAEYLDQVHYWPCKACCGNLTRCRRNNAPEPECKVHFLEWLKENSHD